MIFRQKPIEVPPVPDDPAGQHQYAMETLRLAESNWDNVFNPFRYFKWKAIHREVTARVAALRRKLDG